MIGARKAGATWCAALAVAAATPLLCGTAWARSGPAPVVFANRDAAQAQAAPRAAQPSRIAEPAFRVSAPSGDAPDPLYGYGRGAARNQPVLDLRSRGARTAREDALLNDAFDGDATAEEAPPASDRAPTEFRNAAPARMIPASAPARAVATGPERQRPAWLETERTGAPYQDQVRGQWYVPSAEPDYAEQGIASWYGQEFQGRRTASGEIFDSEALSAAHPTLPIPSLVQVTNLENGREAIVRINDRGPFHANRLIDVSRKTAEVLGFEQAGQARVHVRYLGPAPKRVATDAASAPTALGAPPPLPAASAPAVAQPSAPVTRGGAYVVQAGAFSNPANAERARDRLQSLGVVELVASAGGGLQRVRLGSWATRAEADEARLGAIRLGFTGAVVALAD